MTIRFLIPLIAIVLGFHTGAAQNLTDSDSAASNSDTRSVTESPQAPSWTSLSSALEGAPTNDLKIMVFVYTQWCGFCRRMNETTFTDGGVLTYLGEKFATVRIDAESGDPVELPEQSVTEAQIAQALGVSSFPTIIFMESNGQYITRLPGYLDAENYLQVLEFIGDEHYRTESFEAHLEHG